MGLFLHLMAHPLYSIAHHSRKVNVWEDGEPGDEVTIRDHACITNRCMKADEKT